MTFGYIKSAIENNLLESYKDQGAYQPDLPPAGSHTNSRDERIWRYQIQRKPAQGAR